MSLTVHVVTGMLPGVRQVLCPHCDARPAGGVAELIVMHGISLPPGEFGGRGSIACSPAICRATRIRISSKSTAAGCRRTC